MRRAFFALWLVSAAVLMFVLGQVVHPPIGRLGSPSSLIVASVWLVAVVPSSFYFWFRAQHRREELVVETALKLWSAGDPGAGALVAQALELALAEEDEAALKRLLAALSGSGRVPDAALAPFVTAATEWLQDDGGHSSREEHLEKARTAARKVQAALGVSA